MWTIIVLGYRNKVGVNIATREILLGFWKVHILHHASQEPIHGQWVLTELRRHGYEISPGTLYPLLHRLERNGLLKCRPRRSPRTTGGTAPGSGGRSGGEEAMNFVASSLRRPMTVIVLVIAVVLGA